MNVDHYIIKNIKHKKPMKYYTSNINDACKILIPSSEVQEDISNWSFDDILDVF